MAPHSKRARRHNARIVLIDETGFLSACLVRRSYAPRGKTPKLVRRARHREKVSAIAGLSVSPRAGRIGLDLMTLRNDHFDAEMTAVFLKRLLRKIRGPIIVVCDRGGMHRGPPIEKVLRAHPRLTIEYLPAYAPELNPVEQLWTLLKWGRLHSRPAFDAEGIEAQVAGEAAKLYDDQRALRGFFRASDLPPPGALAS